MINKTVVVKEWQTKADHDLSVVKILIKDSASPKEMIAFHCQQAIEKYLKSFLFQQEVPLPKTHDLDMLYTLCLKENPTFSILNRDKISSMTDYAVESRYPGEQYIPSDQEISQYLLLANQVKEFVKKITDRQ